MRNFLTLLVIFTLLAGFGLTGCSKQEKSAKTEAATEKLEQSEAASLDDLGLLSEERAMAAPQWVMKDLEEKEHKLADFKGKVVILDFWDTWCPPCRKEIPGFVELQDKYGEKGLAIVGVAFGREGKEGVVNFIKEYNVNYLTTMANPQVTQAYGPISSIPTTFIIDREGRVRAMHVGYVKKEKFEKQILALL